MLRNVSERCDFDPDKLILRLDLAVPGDREAVTSVVERIMQVVEDLGCAEGKEHEVALAIQEALANAVIHGCGEDPTSTARITVSCQEDRGILIVVRDPGAGFDPAKIVDPLVGENLYRAHGRGIYLINQLMDEVRFEKGGTEIWMWKR